MGRLLWSPGGGGGHSDYPQRHWGEARPLLVTFPFGAQWRNCRKRKEETIR